MEENIKREFSDDEIAKFLEGKDGQKRIVNVECDYKDNFVSVFSRTENDQKVVSREPFYPFVWAKKEACTRLRNNAEYLASRIDENGNSKLYYYKEVEGFNGKRVKKKVYARNLTEMMRGCGIWFRQLDITNNDGSVNDVMVNGYTFLLYATRSMSYSEFLNFFKILKAPIYSDKKEETAKERARSNEYLAITPVEQYLIHSGKRFFKGYNDYNDTLRMTFDLETTGLDVKKDRIKQFGIRFNRDVHYPGSNEKFKFEKILEVHGSTDEELDKNELECIVTALKIINTFQPDIITAHNGENFDWCLIEGACIRLGTSIEEISKVIFNGKSIYKDKRVSSLKLGGEVEKYNATVVPGVIVTDSLHAVRRSQATDSNFAQASLKYACKYLGIAKHNRVYTPGSEIGKILDDLEEHYAFNDENGNWYLYDENCGNSNPEIKPGKVGDKPFVIYKRNFVADGYTLVSGKYIIERYLLDDLWECDKVEHKLNTSAFFLCKLLPLTFQKCCTMGTAGQWKSLMLAWSYEHGLAIPELRKNSKFVGGLSRLLKVGYIPKCVKFDFNSLYPSIDLTWGIETSKDSSGVMIRILEHFLSGREKYKGMKKNAEKIVDDYEDKINNGYTLTKEEQAIYDKAKADFEYYDKIQNSFKVFCNSYFGSLGSQNASVFPWSDVEAASRTTCTGRQSLRLMISHFTKHNYSAIVGDSVLPDTPLFVKYNNGLIDIKPIEELVDENEIYKDVLGREYDYSKKEYKVLSRSGWVEPKYIYRHKTNKEIYRVKNNDGSYLDVTKDHSLFDENKKEIKPSEITDTTKLESFELKIETDVNTNVSFEQAKKLGEDVGKCIKDRVPITILNCKDKNVVMEFCKSFYANFEQTNNYTKTCLAGLKYLDV